MSANKTHLLVITSLMKFMSKPKYRGPKMPKNIIPGGREIMLKHAEEKRQRRAKREGGRR